MLTLCQASGNQKGVELIEKIQDMYDESSKRTEELMAELLGEEEKSEQVR